MSTQLLSSEARKMHSPTPAAEVIDLTLDDDDDIETVELTRSSSTERIIKKEPDDFSIQTPSTDENQAKPQSTPNHDAPQPGPAMERSEHDGDHENPLQTPEPEDLSSEDQLQMLQQFLANQANGGRRSAEHEHDSSLMMPNEQELEPIDSDEEDALATTAFQAVKRKYETKKGDNEATLTDDIEYQKALNAEDERKRLRQSKKAYQYAEDLHDENSLFIPEKPTTPEPDTDDLFHQDGGTEFGMSRDQRTSMAREMFEIQDSEDESAPQVPQPTLPPKRGRKRKETSRTRTARGGITKPARGRGSGGRGRGRGRGGRRTENLGWNRIDTNELFRHNIIEAATANLAQPAQPSFVGKNRSDALKELIASMPEDQRDLYHGDKVDLDKAAKKFNSCGALKRTAMRLDDEGSWKLRGMKTSLKNYQLIGSSFLREREISKTRPRGGILSDEMGLGKTVMMIANIVDGRPADRREQRATLIVVPSALTTQWMYEIDKHATRDILRDIVVYRSGSRVMATDPIRVLANNDVIITSYHEVLKSMPRNEPPIYLVTPQAKAEWWAKEWEENRGVLHRIYWHRIVLDEAQAIKNYQSKTSEAVCHLEGKFRWAISGTPIQNGLEEPFYPFFRFLRCDHTGSFELFKKNFCKRGSAMAIQRLQVYLAKIMCRRTHENKMFGRPILHLPPIKPVETIEVEFNVVERAIYHIVRTRFVAKIRALGSKDKADKNYRTIFVLLLRLRQLVSSPLLIQKTLKELLETEDLERLWHITDKPQNQSKEDGSRETVESLHMALQTVLPEDPSMKSRNSRTSQDSSDGAILPIPVTATNGGAENKPLSWQFRKYLQSLHESGHWAKANDRSLCHACSRPPVKPYITSCMHLYCQSCLTELQYEAALRDDAHATCLECGLHFLKSESFAARGFEDVGNSTGTPTRSGVRTKKKGSDDEEEDIDWFSVGGPILQSAKTKGAVKKMEEWWAADEDAKIIIFVQFRGLIKIFTRICQEKGWPSTYFHGGMAWDARDLAIKRFTEEPETKVMIAAMKAGGVGLNLVAANRVIICDLWWNQSVETQAWCRVFRIGQKRDVEVARFVVKDSIDTAMLQMQEKKTAEVESAMEEKNRPSRLTTAELLQLFGPFTNPLEGAFTGEDEPFTFVEDPYEKRDDDVETPDAAS